MPYYARVGNVTTECEPSWWESVTDFFEKTWNTIKDIGTAIKTAFTDCYGNTSVAHGSDDANKEIKLINNSDENKTNEIIIAIEPNDAAKLRNESRKGDRTIEFNKEEKVLAGHNGGDGDRNSNKSSIVSNNIHSYYNLNNSSKEEKEEEKEEEKIIFSNNSIVNISNLSKIKETNYDYDGISNLSNILCKEEKDSANNSILSIFNKVGAINSDVINPSEEITLGSSIINFSKENSKLFNLSDTNALDVAISGKEDLTIVDRIQRKKHGITK